MNPYSYDIPTCREKLEYLCKRYYNSTLIVTLLTRWIGDHDSLGHLKYVEEKLNFRDNKKEPDFVFQDDDGEFILGELKITLSGKEIDNTLKQLESYDQEFKLRGSEHKSKPRALFALTHTDHIEDLIDEFEEKKDELDIDCLVVFLSWVERKDSGNNDVLVIEMEEGEETNSSILKEIKKGGVTNKHGKPYKIGFLITERHKRRFFILKDKPPLPYLMHRCITTLQGVRKEHITKRAEHEEFLTCNLTQVSDKFQNQYSNKYNQVTVRWFKEGLRVLEDEGWVKINGSKLKLILEEFRKDRRRDDYWEFFTNKLCRKKVKKRKKREEIQEKLDEEQKSMDEFK